MIVQIRQAFYDRHVEQRLMFLEDQFMWDKNLQGMVDGIIDVFKIDVEKSFVIEFLAGLSVPFSFNGTIVDYIKQLEDRREKLGKVILND